MPPMTPVQLPGQEDLTDMIGLVRGRAQEQLGRGIPAAPGVKGLGIETDYRRTQLAVQRPEIGDRPDELGRRSARRRPRLARAGALALGPVQAVPLPIRDVVDLLPHRMAALRLPQRLIRTQAPERGAEPLVRPVRAAGRILQEAQDLAAQMIAGDPRPAHRRFHTTSLSTPDSAPHTSPGRPRIWRTSAPVVGNAKTANVSRNGSNRTRALAPQSLRQTTSSSATSTA